MPSAPSRYPLLWVPFGSKQGTRGLERSCTNYDNHELNKGAFPDPKEGALRISPTNPLQSSMPTPAHWHTLCPCSSRTHAHAT